MIKESNFKIAVTEAGERLNTGILVGNFLEDVAEVEQAIGKLYIKVRIRKNYENVTLDPSPYNAGGERCFKSW